MSYGQWPIGAQLSDQDVELLNSEYALTEILAATTHPTPGGHFTGPHAGDQLLIAENGWVVSSIPDPANDEEIAVYFLGSDHSHGELLDLAVEFVIDGDHEVAAAVGFHFVEEKLAPWKDDFANAIEQLYWFRCEHHENDFANKLSDRLMSESRIYREIAELLSDPTNEEYSGLKNRILEDWSFEHVYRTHKYQD